MSIPKSLFKASYKANPEFKKCVDLCMQYNVFSEIEKELIKKILEDYKLKQLSKHFNFSEDRIRQIYLRVSRDIMEKFLMKREIKPKTILVNTNQSPGEFLYVVK